MSKARNRNLAGLAGLAALGAVMARGGKKGDDEAVPTPEDRGTMTGDAFTRRADPAAVPAAAAPAAVERAAVRRGPPVDEEGFPLNDEGQRYYLGAASAPIKAAASGRPSAARQTSGASAAPARSAASAAAPARSAASAASAPASAASAPASAASAAAPAASAAAPAASAAAPAASSRGLTLGTPTRPDPRAPSIYAGREAWADYRRRQAEGMKKGGAVKKMASGGSVSSASKRGDGIAQRGKTRGRLV